MSGVRFGLWAPALEHVDLFIEGEIEPLRMQRGDDGWHTLTTPRAQSGSRYWFVLPNGSRMPDPASAFQPEGPNGPSEVVDHVAYRWREPRWKGLPWHTAVIYDIDVGAFSPAGTFNAVREQLRRFVKLGVTALQLGPIAEFRSPYAPAHRLGSPDDLKALVEDAHGLGLMVLLDMAHPPVGAGGDTHSRPVIDFVVGNALHWIERYHFDGLRIGEGPMHILTELAEVVRGRVTYRDVHLFLREEVRHLELLERSRYGEVQRYSALCRGELPDTFGADLPPDAFVGACTPQDDELAQRAMMAVHLLSPQIPLLRMGEEWNAPRGATRLDWADADSPAGRGWRERFSWLLELRHREIIPRIPSIERGGIVRELAPEVMEGVWRVGSVEEIVLVANFGDAAVDIPLPPGRVLWREGAADTPGLAPWSVVWLLRQIRA